MPSTHLPAAVVQERKRDFRRDGAVVLGAVSLGPLEHGNERVQVVAASQQRIGGLHEPVHALRNDEVEGVLQQGAAEESERAGRARSTLRAVVSTPQRTVSASM